MTVTSDSACNKPADSSVWWSSSINNPTARTFTVQISCSVGSSHCFFLWSIAFNCSTVFVGVTLTVRSTPSKVFTFSSRNMAAMASWEFFLVPNQRTLKVLVLFPFVGNVVRGKSVTLMPIVGHGLDIRLVKCDRLPAFKLLKRIQVPRLPCHPIDWFFQGRQDQVKHNVGLDASKSCLWLLHFDLLRLSPAKNTKTRTKLANIQQCPTRLIGFSKGGNRFGATMRTVNWWIFESLNMNH